MRFTRLFALAISATLVLAALGPGATAAAAASQGDAQSSVQGGMFAAADTNGNETAGNVPANTTNATNATSESFGLNVSSFVHQLLANDTNTSNQSMGLLVSRFVVTNNPGAEHRPGFAGPPDNRGPPENAGPPEQAGPPANKTQGHGQDGVNVTDIGQDSDRETGPPESPGGSSSGSGPPSDPGP